MRVAVECIGLADAENLVQRVEEVATEKLKKVEKMLPEDVYVNVRVKREHDIRKCEINVNYRGNHVKGSATSDEHVIDAVTGAVSDLKRRLRKVKGRMEARKYRGNNDVNTLFESDNIEAYNYTNKELGIVKRKTFDIDIMSEADALTQCEMLGHSFFIFMDKDGNTNVLYKRDVGYGVIKVRN